MGSNATANRAMPIPNLRIFIFFICPFKK